jgi:uncharacterized RDD family membrane protein YckC
VKGRLLAALLDYGLMLGWLVALAALFVPLHFAGYELWNGHADAVAFAASVFPVWLYLTVTESRSSGATWGKRRAGLRVVGPRKRRARPARIAVRNAVKLLPWQLAHLGVVALLAGRDAATLVSPGAAWIPISATYALAGLSIALMVSRDDHAALHDLVGGTRVVPVNVKREL